MLNKFRTESHKHYREQTPTQNFVIIQQRNSACQYDKGDNVSQWETPKLTIYEYKIPEPIDLKFCTINCHGKISKHIENDCNRLRGDAPIHT